MENTVSIRDARVKADVGNVRQRVELDLCPTPPECVEALLRFLQLPDGTLRWDPAAGHGGITDVLERANMICTATDIITGTDFLMAKATPGHQEWIITCPPWSQAEKFIRKAWMFRVSFAVLLPSSFWHVRMHSAVFWRNRPAYVLPLTWRPEFMCRSRGPVGLDCLWAVWDRPRLGINHGNTVFELLDRPDNRRMPSVGGMDIQVDKMPGGHQARVAGEYDFR